MANQMGGSGIQNFEGIAHGQETVAASGSPEQLNGGNSIPVPDGAAVWVKGLEGNGGLAYVGDDGVTTGNGYELAAGVEVALYVDDVSDIYVDVGTGGEGVSWVVEQA